MAPFLLQIYEVQTPDEAMLVLKSGVDHIGSVLLPENSIRSKALKETVEVVKDYGSKSSMIPLFSNPQDVFGALSYYQPDIVHFCDLVVDESGRLLNCKNMIRLQENVKSKFEGLAVMRTIPLPENKENTGDYIYELMEMFEPVTDFFLTDTLLLQGNKTLSNQQPVSGFVGITGKTCDWDLAREMVAKSRIPVILAGGIGPDNVRDAVLRVDPAGVDSCTGTNLVDANGKPIRFRKDPVKIKRFAEEAKKAHAKLHPE